MLGGSRTSSAWRITTTKSVLGVLLVFRTSTTITTSTTSQYYFLVS